MFAARGLGGEIAKLLGRPENEGWVFARGFQDTGIFGKGRGGRGGCTSPRAESWHAVLLMLAMASGLSPTAAVRLTCDVALLPFCSVNLLHVAENGGITPERLPTSSYTILPFFGQYLSAIIDAYRVSADPGLELDHIDFGISKGVVFGALHSPILQPPVVPSPAISVVTYQRPFESSTVYFPSTITAVPASILPEIARLLGPVVIPGGRGDEADDADEKSSPVALTAVEMSSCAVH